MSEIKALQTFYNGYRFRSRLEARWAVFFDSLKVNYEYESEGYSLPSGAAYLPDFNLPEIGVFVEVKPTETVEYRELKKIVEFALEGDYQLLLIVGSPTKETMYLVNRRSCASLEELESEYQDDPDDSQKVLIFFEELKEWGRVQFGTTPFENKWTLIFTQLPPYEDFHIREAALKAKQARFEFGEKG